jgi:two-component system OmpR family response regulator
MNILLVEDDQQASDFVAQSLRDLGHSVEQVGDGRQALDLAMASDFDVLVVDRMLPSLDGLTVIETLRNNGRDTPVIIASAMDSVDERVRGLRSGGDDYLVKPFAFQELLARMENVVRRKSAVPQDTILRIADLELDILARTVRRCGQEICLQPREYRLLEYLLRHAGQVMTRSMILEQVWGYRFDPQTNVIDVHISRLRRKIDKGFDVPLIHTVRGAGYSIGEV